ncbi:DUF2213 domain-containing protein [Alicyclobacillus sendaiensis]|uniref:DUF2213 domain-containing protein n=1 Tax=Alicyclobacillus sendaiensis TaxID=192387 RepID=UPI000781587B|nr:DUF2213 domain-containing protein [Alicyclobacillus sendaiensis]
MRTARAYYGSRFSPNQTMTPEGFLVAHNVPIARTGWYEYWASEIGADTSNGDRVVKVYRSPEEVFAPAAMASFEGKPVTDDHPPSVVTPENAHLYAKGAVQNVRRGSGENSDLLLADLVIYDEQLIQEIRAGKREVSAGYECDYVDNGDGTYSQRNIVGNHVAVVYAGRAGDRVRILDQKPDVDDETTEASRKYGIAPKSDGHRSPPKGYPEDREKYGDPVNYKYPIDREHIEPAVQYFNRAGQREDGEYTPEEWSIIGKRIASAANRLLSEGYEYKDGKIITPNDKKEAQDRMSTKLKLPARKRSRVTDFLAAMGLKHFAQDAEPEDIMEAVDAMAEEKAEDPAATNDEDTPEDVKAIEELKSQFEQRFAALEEMLKQALAKDENTEEKSAEELIDDAIAQMEDPEDTPPREDENEESHTIDPEMIQDGNPDEGPVAPKEDRPQNGFATLDTAYKIAALRAIKPIIAAIPDPAERKRAADAAIKAIKGKPKTNTYAQIERARKRAAQDAAQKQAPSFAVDPNLGREWAKKYNPHYKNRAQ